MKKFFTFLILINFFLNAQTTPVITLQPQNTIAIVGDTASFKVEATCDGTLGYQWWRSPYTGPESEIIDVPGKISGASTSNLKIINVTSRDNQTKYLYEVKNLDIYPNNGSWINSNIATLTVNNPMQLSITPPFQGVLTSSGSVDFDLKNIGSGDMNWTAVSNDPSWLTITSGSSGLNDGQIQVSYLANSGDYRVGTITVTAPGALNSPMNLEVRQTAFGSDWTVKTSGTNKNLNDVKFIGSQLGWAVGDSGTILHTSNSGNSWIKQNTPIIYNLNKVFFINSSIGFAVEDSGVVLKTTDGGDVWEFKNSGATNSLRSVNNFV